jgi:hypothetical protein
VLIFDELTYPLNYGWLDTAEVLADIRGRPAARTSSSPAANAPTRWWRWPTWLRRCAW